MYKFRISTDEELKDNFAGGGECVYGLAATEEKFALFFGKVRRLFGENDSFSDDWENMYNYDITAEDEQGNKLYFSVYHGSGGSSIGTPFSDELPPDYQQAKKELIEYIESAEPVDYVHDSVYYDVPVNVRYTVKDGKAYVESEFPEDMEDFM
ncbi:MAG: hypothetical protein K2J37_05865 [Ruminococcus sp.]|nr:hypothetical protein [Ruminococcus sp.]MDE6785248.1 hypothetical protein [Ruminococcus sp.]